MKIVEIRHSVKQTDQGGSLVFTPVLVDYQQGSEPDDILRTEIMELGRSVEIWFEGNAGWVDDAPGDAGQQGDDSGEQEGGDAPSRQRSWPYGLRIRTTVILCDCEDELGAPAPNGDAVGALQ